MSIAWMVDIWKHSDTRGTLRLVLLAIADAANDEGMCWPSYETIACKAGCDRRRAIRMVKYLEDNGYIKVIRRYDPEKEKNMSNLYQLLKVMNDDANKAVGKVEDPKVTAYRERLAKAMDEGNTQHFSLMEQINKSFHISPNWRRKDWSELVLWLKQVPKDQTVDKFAKWWYASDWRGKQGQPPMADQIRELWPQAFQEPKASEPVRKNDDGTLN